MCVGGGTGDGAGSQRRGGGADLVQTLKAPVTITLRWLAASLAITAFVDMLVIAALWLLARLIERISNRRITYKN